MGDGTIVMTDNAERKWAEDTRWDGNNYVSVSTASQWAHQTLYLSTKGRYYIETTSQWQGSSPACEYVGEEDAARWLVANGHDIPSDLKEYAEKLTE